MENGGGGENMIRQLTMEQNAQIGGGVGLFSIITTALGMSIGVFIDLMTNGRNTYIDRGVEGVDYKVLVGERSRFGALGALGGFLLGEFLAGNLF